jgi:hypothetical protein
MPVIDLAQPSAFAAQIMDRSRQTVVVSQHRQPANDE